jgi:hypothetical protein
MCMKLKRFLRNICSSKNRCLSKGRFKTDLSMKIEKLIAERCISPEEYEDILLESGLTYAEACGKSCNKPCNKSCNKFGYKTFPLKETLAYFKQNTVKKFLATLNTLSYNVIGVKGITDLGVKWILMIESININGKVILNVKLVCNSHRWNDNGFVFLDKEEEYVYI